MNRFTLSNISLLALGIYFISLPYHLDTILLEINNQEEVATETRALLRNELRNKPYGLRIAFKAPRLTSEERNYWIDYIFKRLGKDENLQEIDINDNKLTVLPASIEQFTNLKKIEAAHNLLKNVSPLGQLFYLENINVQDNKLTDLSWLRDLIHISQLNVAENDISVIPTFIGDLHQLKQLNLHRNALSSPTSLPDSMVNLTQLEYIDLTGNPVSQDPPNILKRLYHHAVEIEGVELTRLKSNYRGPSSSHAAR